MDFVLFALLGLVGFTLSMILAAVVRVEKHLFRLSQDFSIIADVLARKK